MSVDHKEIADSVQAKAKKSMPELNYLEAQVAHSHQLTKILRVFVLKANSLEVILKLSANDLLSIETKLLALYPANTTLYPVQSELMLKYVITVLDRLKDCYTDQNHLAVLSLIKTIESILKSAKEKRKASHSAVSQPTASQVHLNGKNKWAPTVFYSPSRVQSQVYRSRVARQSAAATAASNASAASRVQSVAPIKDNPISIAPLQSPLRTATVTTSRPISNFADAFAAVEATFAAVEAVDAQRTKQSEDTTVPPTRDESQSPVHFATAAATSTAAATAAAMPSTPVVVQRVLFSTGEVVPNTVVRGPGQRTNPSPIMPLRSLHFSPDRKQRNEHQLRCSPPTFHTAAAQSVPPKTTIFTQSPAGKKLRDAEREKVERLKRELNELYESIFLLTKLSPRKQSPIRPIPVRPVSEKFVSVDFFDRAQKALLSRIERMEQSITEHEQMIRDSKRQMGSFEVALQSEREQKLAIEAEAQRKAAETQKEIDELRQRDDQHFDELLAEREQTNEARQFAADSLTRVEESFAERQRLQQDNDRLRLGLASNPALTTQFIGHRQQIDLNQTVAFPISETSKINHSH